MLTPIKNDYIYQSELGSQPLIGTVQGASQGDGSALFTYNTFLGYGTDVWDSYYGPWRSHAIAVALTRDGYTAGDQIDLTSRRLDTQLLVGDGTGAFLYLSEATASGISGVGGGYQVLTVDGLAASEGPITPVTDNFTYATAPTAVLPGTSTFFVHRAGDQDAAPGVYTNPRAAFDQVTISDGVPSYTTVARNLPGYLDIRGVVPVDATTAYAVAGPLNMNGDTTTGQIQLRFYELTTTDGLVGYNDIYFATPMDNTAPYRGTTSEYPVEIFSWGPDPDGPSGPATPGSSEVLRRWGLRHDSLMFSLEQMPLEQIDAHAKPPGASGTDYLTFLYDGQYVPVGDQIYVARIVVDNSATTSHTNNTYVRITQYDGVTGAVVDEAWSLAPDPDPGMTRNRQSIPLAFYDASLDQLAVATIELATQTSSPFHHVPGIRLATFSLGATYPISEQVRSTGSAFLG